MKNKLVVLSGIVLGSAPFMALAQQNQTGVNLAGKCGAVGQISTIQTVLCKFSEILNAVIPVLVALGVVYFIWGVISYVIGNDEEAKKKGRDRMIFGIIGLVVIVGMWGLVRIVTNTFGLNNSSIINYPTVPY